MTSQIIDMRFIRYLNLFEKITGVRTKNCFSYNNFLVYAVDRKFVSKAIGENGANTKKLNEILGRRIKIIFAPSRESEIKEFIESLVSPVTFKDLQITPSEIVISGSMQARASLIGRDKVRLGELKKITKEMLNKDVKIVAG